MKYYWESRKLVQLVKRLKNLTLSSKNAEQFQSTNAHDPFWYVVVSWHAHILTELSLCKEPTVKRYEL